jgi:hypothetical protein
VGYDNRNGAKFLIPDPNDLRRQYEAMTDEALLAVERGDLIEIAQQCYDEELVKRGMALADDVPEELEAEPEPDWMDDAACACSFNSRSGRAPTEDINIAREALETAGIPCYLQVRKMETADGQQSADEYDLLIPAQYSMQALSVLDKEIYNAEAEASFRAHLEALSDEDLKNLDMDSLLGGLIDRLQRLNQAYEEELDRRGGAA